MTRPKHITEGHVMRRYACGLTEARAILARMERQGEIQPVHNAQGRIMYFRDLTSVKQ